jgi:hypothetical protein
VGVEWTREEKDQLFSHIRVVVEGGEEIYEKIYELEGRR